MCATLEQDEWITKTLCNNYFSTSPKLNSDLCFSPILFLATVNICRNGNVVFGPGASFLVRACAIIFHEEIDLSCEGFVNRPTARRVVHTNVIYFSFISDTFGYWSITSVDCSRKRVDAQHRQNAEDEKMLVGHDLSMGRLKTNSIQ